jgi:peptidoglycan/LPS O-acetylase OafA/YrhL
MATAQLCREIVQGSELESRKAKSELGYKPSLDGVRAFAVLVVMAWHADLPLFGGGHVGVDVFFVLSGFLITTLLVEEWDRSSQIDLKYFYARRALRLLPALLGLLIFLQAFALIRLHGSYFWTVQKSIVASLFYCANWMRVSNNASMGPIPHTWSLSVEEQFYFLWPPILLLLLPRIRKNHLIVLLLLIISLLAFHRSVLWTGEASWSRIYNGTDTRIDELLFGCVAALLVGTEWFRSRSPKKIIDYLCFPAGSLLLGFLVRPMSHRTMSIYGWVPIELAIAVLLCWIVSAETGFIRKALSFAPMAWIGKISYGLYLWHVPIFFKIGGLNLPNTAKTITMFTVSLTAAAFSHYFIERPFLRLKAKMRRSVQVLVQL